MTPRTQRFAAVAVVSALVMTSMSAHGAQPTGLVITDQGYFFVTANSDGTLVQTKVTQVMDLRTGSNPTPIPTPPDVSDPIAKQVKGWAAEIGDPTSAQALAIAYREVGKVSAGQSRENVMTALRMASDSVLQSTSGTEKWKPWRTKVSGLIDAEEAKGPIDWQKFCESVAAGLEASAPSPALDAALIKLIVDAVLQIIKLIFNLTGGGVGGV